MNVADKAAWNTPTDTHISTSKNTTTHRKHLRPSKTILAASAAFVLLGTNHAVYSQEATDPLTVSGTNGSTEVRLGEELRLIGSNANITTTAENGQLQIELSNQLDLSDPDSRIDVGGGTIILGDGITIAGDNVLTDRYIKVEDHFTDSGAITIGSYASALGTSATALNASANGDGAVAIGGGTFGSANAYGEGAVAIGARSNSSADRAFALGGVASVADAIALGSDSYADRPADITGYDPSTKTTYAGPDSPTWTSTHAALSVGNSESYTRCDCFELSHVYCISIF